MAGLNLRNTLQYVEESASFICEAFEYMSTDPAQFHFVYPAAAEVSEGVLVAPQDGKWKPMSVASTEAGLIESLPTITFTPLTAALELRVFDTDKTTPVAVSAVRLTAATDWVGKWTLNDDMTYTQSYEGTEVYAEFEESAVVTINMPDYPEGVADGFFTIVLYDNEGGVKMTRTLPAMSFVKGKRTVVNLVFVADPEEGGDGGEGGGGTVEPDPEEPEVITGTFTCATYNVDGLPEKVLGLISLNSDGPGSDGTTAISQKIATSGWDIVTFQENFTYNDELMSKMSSYYSFGTHREFSIEEALSTADTDGLGFATLNATCSFSSESWVAFTEKYGNLTNGADENLKKGFRHYVVTMNNDSNVVIDVLVTHMNSGSELDHINARKSQLTQIATYINSIRSNNRPIILMGDTNCRYTRDYFKDCFWSVLDSDLVVADPWVEYSWAGVYPTLGSASLMVPSKDSSSTLTEQTGEVVDKIIYINNPNAKVHIKANDYMNDTAYAGMADHNPVRSTFTYTYAATE